MFWLNDRLVSVTFQQGLSPHPVHLFRPTKSQEEQNSSEDLHLLIWWLRNLENHQLTCWLRRQHPIFWCNQKISEERLPFQSAGHRLWLQLNVVVVVFFKLTKSVLFVWQKMDASQKYSPSFALYLHWIKDSSNATDQKATKNFDPCHRVSIFMSISV